MASSVPTAVQLADASPVSDQPVEQSTDIRRRSADNAASIVQTFLLPNSHGKCQRCCCECLLIVGVMLPLLGPLLGFCVAVPYLDLQFEEGSVIQPDTPCYGPQPTVCGATSSFDYYFWNISNPMEVCSSLCTTDRLYRLVSASHYAGHVKMATYGLSGYSHGAVVIRSGESQISRNWTIQLRGMAAICLLSSSA